MAITVTKEPFNYSPAYNEQVFEFETNSNEANFRFYIEMKLEGDLMTAPIRLPKRPNSMKAILDVKEIVATYVKNEFLQNGGSARMKLNTSFLEYEIEIGEEYSGGWQYDDYEFNSNIASVFNGYTKLVSTLDHSFVVGDQIEVVQSDGGVLKPAVSGLHTVVEIPNSKQIVLNIPWVGSGIAIAGVASYADGRKTVVKNLASKTKTVFNGAYDVRDYQRNYDGADFATSPRRWSASVEGFRVLPNFDFRLNIFNWGLSAFNLNVTTDDGFVGVITNNGTASDQFFISDDMDMYSSNNRSKLILPTTKEITVKAGTLSREFKFLVNHTCPVDRLDLLFVDRFGSWMPFYFDKVNELLTESVKETIVNENLERETIGANERIGYLLRSGYLNEAELELFNILITSPEVKMKVGEHWEKVYLTTTTTQTARNRMKKSKEVNLYFSKDNRVNI